jgi:hypothetical protein
MRKIVRAINFKKALTRLPDEIEQMLNQGNIRKNFGVG